MLWPCSECRRHIRIREQACPFCSSPVTVAPPGRLRAPHRNLSRAAQVAFYVALAGASVVTCAPHATPPPVEPEPAMPIDAGTEAASEPAVDAGADGAEAAEEDAAQRRVIAIYGSTEIVILETIAFKPGSDQVPKAAFPTLDAIAEIMEQHTFVVELEGYSTPNEKLKGLAERRAKKVRELLVARGVPLDRLQVVDRMAKPDPSRPPPNPAEVRFHIVPGTGDAP